MSKITLYLSLLFTVSNILSSSLALGGNPPPPSVDYRTYVEGNKVLICPSSGQDNICPNRHDLLRQNVKTGEVVQLFSFCEDSPTTYGKTCYVDECVPVGTYRYGFANPYSCPPPQLSTYIVYWYEEATITKPITDCKRSKDKQLPTTYNQKVPWKDDSVMCQWLGICGCQTIVQNNGISASIFCWLGVFLFLLFLQRRTRRKY